MNFFLILMSLNIIMASGFVKSLKDASTIELESLTKKTSLILLFQADCHACKKQVRDLKCLEKDYEIVLLGSFSTEQDLRQEYLKMGVSYPAYYANQDILYKIGITMSATPQIVVSNKGRLLKYLGYIKCQSLKKAIQGV